MSQSSYPAPPDENAPHPYTPLYAQHPNAQLLDAQPPRGVPAAYPPPPEAGYPKLENINEVLQAQALHANHALTDQRPPPPPGSGPVAVSPVQQHHQQSPSQQQKPNRLRKACDSCSIRKVKCDESGPPCRACLALEIPCTFDRPSRRRGPPNRHAEAIKKRRLDDADPAVCHPSPQSPTNAAHALAQLQSSNPTQLSADAICPLATMHADRKSVV